MVATIIEKGPSNERIKPREAPRVTKKMLNMNMMQSVASINGSLKNVAEQGSKL